MLFDYSNAKVQPRPDLALAHQRAWQHIASPGTWWTGLERVAIAAETRLARDCSFCAERKAALSPYGHNGQHASSGRLKAAAIEAVHRLTTDPGRLKKQWLDGLTGGLKGDLIGVELAGTQESFSEQDRITVEQYVELIGVVTQVVSVDWFHIALGLPLEDLPLAREGEPTFVRPPGALPEDAWVPMILPENLDEANHQLYGPGKHTGNVIRALSLVPNEVRELKALSAAHYLSGPQMMHFDRNYRSISRAQMELIAGRISALNECFY